MQSSTYCKECALAVVTKIMIEKRLNYETEKPKLDTKKIASREQLLEMLSPVYTPDQLKNLDDDELKDLLDEVIDRVYKVKLADGGSADDDKPKPVDPFKLMLQLNQMSDAEREQLEYMLEKLGVKKK